jgi:hypothetical protein
MAPPNMGAPSQAGRKTWSSRASQEAVEPEQETRQPEEFIDVDANPSSVESPIYPTPVVEERQEPTALAMEVDLTNNVQGHPAHNIGNPPDTAVAEGVSQVNGQATIQIEA